MVISLATEGHDSIVKLTPKISRYSIQLNAHNRYFCRYYPSAVMVFNGLLDITRFIDALNNALNYFPFLFGQLNDDGQNLHISFDQAKKNRGGYVICEFATFLEDSYLEIHKAIKMYLPQHLPPHLSTMPENVNGLIMIQFKVTQCGDGFILGYTFNHACLDQASLLYFFKYLVASYHKNDVSKFIVPHLLDTFNLLETSNKKIAYDHIEFDTVARSIGRINKTTVTASPIVDHLQIQISFNQHSLSEYCQTLNQYCSSNDIINAFLIKIYALQNHHAFKSDTLSIEMAANCRSRLGLSESMIGNIVATVGIKNIPVKIVKSSSLIDLSLMIRQHVKAYSHENFLLILNWYYQSSLLNNSEQYIAEYLINPSIIMTTNWQGFDYSKIMFEDSKLLAILQPPQQFYRLFLGVITFDNRWQHEIILSVQIPKSILNKTRELCEGYSSIRLISI